MPDIGFCTKILNLLIDSGFKTNTVAIDEEGDEHCIEFSNSLCFGKICTNKCKIVYIESEDV